MRNQMVRWDGEDLYWSELRPDEAGRIVVCRREPNGVITDVTPPGFNARTRVHEYGGGHFAVSGGTVWFINFKDQRLYRQDAVVEPQPITPAIDVRHADMAVDTRRGRLLAVREDHTTGAPEAVNTLVSLDCNGDRDVITVAAGNDFYSSPKLSPDGNRVAWTTWNHPNMPWDGTELWVSELDRDGHVTSSRKIAGGRRRVCSSTRVVTARRAVFRVGPQRLVESLPRDGGGRRACEPAFSGVRRPAVGLRDALLCASPVRTRSSVSTRSPAAQSSGASTSTQA